MGKIKDLLPGQREDRGRLGTIIAFFIRAVLGVGRHGGPCLQHMANLRATVHKRFMRLG